MKLVFSTAGGLILWCYNKSHIPWACLWRRLFETATTSINWISIFSTYLLPPKKANYSEKPSYSLGKNLAWFNTLYFDKYKLAVSSHVYVSRCWYTDCYKFCCGIIPGIKLGLTSLQFSIFSLSVGEHYSRSCQSSVCPQSSSDCFNYFLIFQGGFQQAPLSCTCVATKYLLSVLS